MNPTDTRTRPTVEGRHVRPGDVLHDHDDAVVLSVTHEAAVATATVRYTGGDTGRARWGLAATMTVTRPTTPHTCPPCPVCGTATTLEVERFGLARWQEGHLVQNALPDLDAGTRELLVSGTHPDCWTALFDEDGE
jgi:hypothetical protein